MAEETKQSGDTIQHDWDNPQHIFIEDYVDEEYDEEMETYRFTFYSYSGNWYKLSLTEYDINRFYLYMKKEQLEKRYFKHVIKK